MVQTSIIKLTSTSETLFKKRIVHSNKRLKALEAKLKRAAHLDGFKELTIYATGSHARRDASKHSDIDPFFITRVRRANLKKLRVPQIRLMSEFVDACETMKFPEFSNDGQYLKIIFSDEMLENLGSPEDDHSNHFTARMLLLLESYPLYGAAAYEKLLKEIIQSYFRDYPHHPKDFRPTFLINDILRFWKTLCLNYEHKRNQKDARAKTKHKIKNFKLGYSRLLTCFATVAALSTYKRTIKPKDVLAICRMTPVDRLSYVLKTAPHLKREIEDALELYAWFLRKTGLTTKALETFFRKKKNREIAFAKSRAFGDEIFQILRALDEKNRTMRYLVV